MKRATLDRIPTVGVIAGAGATTRSQQMLEHSLTGSGAVLIAMRAFWTARPNDKHRLAEPNREVALQLARQLGFAAATGELAPLSPPRRLESRAASGSPTRWPRTGHQNGNPAGAMHMTNLAIAVVALTALLAWSAWLRAGFTAVILDAAGKPLPGSIATLERVQLGGVEQGILIRGHNVANPILLYLHGGPGTSELGMVRMHNIPVLEQHYTLAVWDQRGAGLSYAACEPESGMTVEQFIADAHELTLLLCRRFRQPKIYLVGHSWGSLLGVLTVQRHPELYHAYVGVGQVVDMREGERISYEWTLAQAEKASDARSVARLEAIGPPPYGGELRPKLMTQRRILGKFGGEVHGNPRGGMSTFVRGLLSSSEYSWLDRINVFRGIFANMCLMWPKILAIDLRVQVPELKVPVYFLEGRYDYEAPAVLAERYFQQLRAPRKELIWFERSAHFVNTEEADKFNRFFVDRLLPETYRPAFNGERVRSASVVQN